MRTEPERAAAVRPELMPPELQQKMVAAFERARAERLAAQMPRKGARRAGDPRTRANTAAFLILERERRAIASRLSRSYRRPADRYRDLILVTKLIRLEYEHLAGRVGERADPAAPPNGLPVGGDMPADWARPWGSGPMVEIGTAFTFYRDQRHRLARQLSTRTLRDAAAAAARHRDRILTRFEGAMGEWRPELERGRAALAGSGKRQSAAAIAEAAGDEKRAWTWASLRLTRPAAALTAVFVAVGVGTVIAETRGGGSPSFVSAASPAVASVPVPVAKLPREPQPTRGRGTHGASHKSRTPQRNEGREANQAVLTASEIPPAAPPPEVTPAPIAPAAPVATPAPTPAPPPDEPPAPKPRPDPKPRPGPVSTLPPPVGTLPPPVGSGGGGG